MLFPLAWVPGPVEWVFIGGIALLIFGKRLPEVARSMGKGVVEFKKGLKGIDDDVNDAGAAPPARPAQQYKFDPYTGKPIDSNATPPSAG
jgi:sec-independent protein translocase protein TatA